jgi:hypothetical protein
VSGGRGWAALSHGRMATVGGDTATGLCVHFHTILLHRLQLYQSTRMTHLKPNKRVESNRRPAGALDAGRELGRVVCDLSCSTAAVAHACRSVSEDHDHSWCGLTCRGFSKPGNGTGYDSGTQPQTEMGMRHDTSVALQNIEMP